MPRSSHSPRYPQGPYPQTPKWATKVRASTDGHFDVARRKSDSYQTKYVPQCYNCGEKGHMKRECTRVVQGKGKSRGSDYLACDPQKEKTRVYADYSVQGRGRSPPRRRRPDRSAKSTSTAHTTRWISPPPGRPPSKLKPKALTAQTVKPAQFLQSKLFLDVPEGMVDLTDGARAAPDYLTRGNRRSRRCGLLE